MSDYERNTGELYPKTEQEVQQALENIEGFDDYDNLREAANQTIAQFAKTRLES